MSCSQILMQNCHHEFARSGGLFIGRLQARSAPALTGQKWLAAAVRFTFTHGRRLLLPLRALVPSGLACVLARPPYDEAQTAIWAARWAKLPDAARRFTPLALGRYFSCEGLIEEAACKARARGDDRFIELDNEADFAEAFDDGVYIVPVRTETVAQPL